MKTLEHVVVVGASLAGLRACEALRQEGFEGTITLVGDETEIPYDRPPLSKKVLSGEWEPERIRLRKPDDIESLQLQQRLGVRALSLDQASGSIALSDGETLTFGALVIATGASPRRLPGQPDLGGVHVLRTLGDSLRLRDEIADGAARVVVIGAGFIGLEAAATARQKGCTVTVLEAGPAPLVRGLGPELGAAVASVHARHGVPVRCGVQVAALLDDGAGHVSAVRLASGEEIGADVVLVGVGVAPNTEWLASSGLALRDGIVCDPTLNVGRPGIYAAGDCARWPNAIFAPHGDTEMRVEHWTNAAEQGAAAARNLLAVSRGEQPVPFESVPFFWSDQYESRIQYVGRAHGGDDIHLVAGTLDGDFAALYGWEGRLRGVVGVNMPKMVMPFRALLASRASWDEALVKAAALAG